MGSLHLRLFQAISLLGQVSSLVKRRVISHDIQRQIQALCKQLQCTWVEQEWECGIQLQHFRVALCILAPSSSSVLVCGGQQRTEEAFLSMIWNSRQAMFQLMKVFWGSEQCFYRQALNTGRVGGHGNIACWCQRHLWYFVPEGPWPLPFLNIIKSTCRYLFYLYMVVISMCETVLPSKPILLGSGYIFL